MFTVKYVYNMYDVELMMPEYSIPTRPPDASVQQGVYPYSYPHVDVGLYLQSFSFLEVLHVV